MSDHFGRPRPGVPDVRRYKTTMSSLVDLTAGEYRVLRGNPCEGGCQLLPWHIADGPGGS